MILLSTTQMYMCLEALLFVPNKHAIYFHH